MALVESRRPSRSPVLAPISRRPVDFGPAPMDLRLRVPLRRAAIAAGFLGAVAVSLVVSFLGRTSYVGQAEVLGLKQDDPNPGLGVELVERRIQSLASIARSDAYIVELARRAGVPADLDRLSRMVTATRPRVGALIVMTVSGPDQQEVRQLAEQLVPTLNAMVDRMRSGASIGLAADGRDLSASVASDYRGPLYLDLYQGRPDLSQRTPGGVTVALVGFGLGVMATGVVSLAAHSTRRVTSREQLELLFTMPQLARLPRLGLRKDRRLEDYVKGVALAVDGAVVGEPALVALGGSGIRRERATFTLALGAGLAATMDRPVLIVDLDVEHADLSARLGLRSRLRRRSARGLSDVVSDSLAPESVVHAVKRRSVPRAVRRVLPRRGGSLLAMGAGSHLGEPLMDDAAVVEVLRRFSDHLIVLAHLPRIPGPSPVQAVLGLADLSVLTVLDGWSKLDDAETAAGMLTSSAGGRAQFVLLEN